MNQYSWFPNEHLRLQLDTTEPSKTVTVTADKKEWEALVGMLEREFIPHEIYEEIHSLLKKINGQLAG